MFRKLFPVIIVVLALIVSTASTTLAAPPAPRAEEQSQFNPVMSVQIVDGADGQKYAVAGYEGIYARLVVEYDNTGMPQINMNGRTFTGAAADTMLRSATRGMYTLPAQLDSTINNEVLASGLQTIQANYRSGEFTLSTDGKKALALYADGLTHIGSLLEKTSVLSGTLPAGTFDAIMGGVAFMETLGLDQWDVAVITANYRTSSTPATMTWPEYRQAKAIPLSAFAPKPAASAPTAPKTAMIKAYKVVSGDSPWAIATKLVAKGYDYNATFTYLKDFNTKYGMWAGQPIPLPVELESKTESYDFVD